MKIEPCKTVLKEKYAPHLKKHCFSHGYQRGQCEDTDKLIRKDLSPSVLQESKA